MTTQSTQISTDENMRKNVLNDRMEDFGWGVLLLAIGSIWLVPEKQVPQGSWLIAAGLIMLGLNAARYFMGIGMSSFSLILGAMALIAGLGAFFGMKLPLLAIALIVIGISMLLKSLLEPSQTPGGRGWTCCGPEEKASSRAPGHPAGR